MMVVMMNCFCSMVDRRKAFSLLSSRDHCQKSSPSWISDTPRAGFEPAQNLTSGLVEWSCAVVILHHSATQQLQDNFILREKVSYLELLWSIFSIIWTEYGDIWSISPYSVQMRENTDQNNSEYGHFLPSVIYSWCRFSCYIWLGKKHE